VQIPSGGNGEGKAEEEEDKKRIGKFGEREREGYGKGRAEEKGETRMWANAQRDGRPAEHRWRPLFNAAKFG